MPVIRVETIRTENHEMEITGAELVGILQDAGYKIPQATTIYFSVPVGGDWSNTSIDIDERNPLRLKWGTVERT